MQYQIHQLAVGGYDHNFAYLIVAPNGDAALIDPSGDAEFIRRAVEEAGTITPRYILLTHGHQDHYDALGDTTLFFPAPTVGSPRHPANPAIKLRDGQELPFGDGHITAIAAPGHTMDSYLFRLGDTALFSGDTLFVDYIGFCRSKDMFRTLCEKIMPLPDQLVVYSGHDYGSVPFRTLGEEKQHNPYLKCDSYEAFREQLLKLE